MVYCGFILEKRRGSLAKPASRTGTRCSGPLDLISMAENPRRRQRRRDSPETKLRGGARLGSPELGVPAAPVGHSSRLQAGRHHHGLGNTSRGNRSGQNYSSDDMTVRGGSGRRTHRRAVFQALRAAFYHDIWRNRTRERRRGSPRGCGGRSCDGRWKSTTTGGG
jgi:hypothetical protein